MSITPIIPLPPLPITIRADTSRSPMSVRHQDILMPPQTDGELFTSRLRVLHTSASQPKKLPFLSRNTDCDSQSERALSESITPITAMERCSTVRLPRARREIGHSPNLTALGIGGMSGYGSKVLTSIPVTAIPSTM